MDLNITFESKKLSKKKKIALAYSIPALDAFASRCIYLLKIL